ncbi:MAG: hypothetical protein V1735_07775 [Nanoarchaeota archaeon]
MKRAQQSMEYIMTYGFAILAILAAIGALSYFGVFHFDRLMPPKCSFPLDLACVEEPSMTSDSVSVTLVNNLGKDITIDPKQTPWAPANDATGGYSKLVVYHKDDSGNDQWCRDGLTPACTISSEDRFIVSFTPKIKLSKGSRISTTPGFTYKTSNERSFVVSGDVAGKVG